MSYNTLGLTPTKGAALFRSIEPEQTPKSIIVEPLLDPNDTVDASLLLSVRNDDVVINGTAVADEDTGEAGDATETEFDVTTAENPVVPHSATFTSLAESDDHLMTLIDRGDGTLYTLVTDDDGVTTSVEAGTIDYFTGAAHLIFPEAVKNLQAILAHYSHSTLVAMNGIVNLVPDATSDVLPLLPYWGQLKIDGYSDLPKRVNVSGQLASYQSSQIS